MKSTIDTLFTAHSGMYSVMEWRAERKRALVQKVRGVEYFLKCRTGARREAAASLVQGE